MPVFVVPALVTVAMRSMAQLFSSSRSSSDDTEKHNTSDGDGSYFHSYPGSSPQQEHIRPGIMSTANEPFEATTLTMDPGSPAPQTIVVKRRSSSFKHVEFRPTDFGEPSDDELTLMEEVGEDAHWMLTSSLAGSPEDLMRAAKEQGVALQAIHFKRPEIKVLIRVPDSLHDNDDMKCFVRYTYNGWQTYDDMPARHCSDCLGKMPGTELYRTRLPLPRDEHGVLQFAICVQSEGKEYWDNNFGSNHTVKPIAD